MARKLKKTLADYIAIAISPVLIMLLVGSLAFFLLEVLYSGGFPDRLRWILFWFVMASVLVARIGIEQGKEHAAAYGLALGAATAFVSARFIDGVIVAWLLLAVIWWCANKLTWDCTLIDDRQDASGEGLLQIAGFDEQAADGPSADSIDEPSDPKPRRPPWLKRLLLNASQPTDKPHAPGLWVVYFSLAALPLFGIGQLFVEERSRRYGFQLLWAYVAAGLGLLVTTSFLGLRRYLRQRRLQMPPAMTGSWIGMGGGLIIAILAICLILPRPDGSLSALADRIDSFSRDASRFALLKDDAGEGDGDNRGRDEEADPEGGAGNSQKKSDKTRKDDRQAAQAEGKAESGNAQGKSESKESSGGQGENSGKGKGEQKGKQGEDSSGKSDESGETDDQAEQEQQQADSGEEGEEQGGEQESAEDSANQETPPSTDPSSAVETLANLIKWVIYGVVALVVLYLVIRNWSQITAAIARFVQDFINFWKGLFGTRRERTADEAEAELAAATPPPPFDSFRNPFTSGMADKASPAQLVRYSFDALQAWAIEQNAARRPDQTPIEFAQSLQTPFAEVGRDAVPLARLYAGLAYADRKPTADCLSTLERLWRRLTSA